MTEPHARRRSEHSFWTATKRLSTTPYSRLGWASQVDRGGGADEPVMLYLHRVLRERADRHVPPEQQDDRGCPVSKREVSLRLL